MSSKLSSNGAIQIDPNDSDTSLFLPIRASSHRTSSFSSISSLSSNSSLSSFRDESPIFSPKSPLQSTRIPFSWERLPGIPKRQLSEKGITPLNILPLPPSGKQFPYRKLSSRDVVIKKYDGESFRKDPFFAALVECSKDDDHKIHNQQFDPIFGKFSKVGRSLSEGFALVSISTSCKNTCTVSDSMVLVPRLSKHNCTLSHTKKSSKHISPRNTTFSFKQT